MDFSPRALAIADEPADGQGDPAVRPHFHRHLVGGAAHPAGFHLDQRLDVVHRLVKELQGVVAPPLAHDVHGVVQDALGRALLAPLHQTVDEPAHQRIVDISGLGGRVF